MKNNVNNILKSVSKSKSTSKSKSKSKSKSNKLHKKLKLPYCDGKNFPFVKQCYNDSTNWSKPNPKTDKTYQCIITNPGNTNLAPGSIYSCGRLW